MLKLLVNLRDQCPQEIFVQTSLSQIAAFVEPKVKIDELISIMPE